MFFDLFVLSLCGFILVCVGMIFHIGLTEIRKELEDA